MALTRTTRRSLAAAAAIAIGAALLAYLRDPPWLLHVTSGLRGWETAADGTRYRWMSGRASFFVPADVRAIEIPLRAEFDRPSDWPIRATVSVDDAPAAELTMRDGRWRRAVVCLPERGSRRVRRIDLRADRTRPGERGLMVGEVVPVEPGC